jgi:hypothetical protein
MRLWSAFCCISHLVQEGWLTNPRFPFTLCLIGPGFLGRHTWHHLFPECEPIFERLFLLDLCRLSCRSCAVDSGFSSAGLRPCDWKLGKVLSSLHTFVCSHPVEFRYASQQVGRFFWALAKLFRFSSEVLCHQEIKSFDYHRRHWTFLILMLVS